MNLRNLLNPFAAPTPLEVKLGPVTLNTQKQPNIFISGCIGAGKTSSGMYPLIQQLLAQDNEANKKENLGGLILDGAGDYTDYLISAMHNQKRNVLKDLILLSSCPYYTVAQLEEVDTKETFFLAANDASQLSESSEFTRLLKETNNDTYEKAYVSATTLFTSVPPLDEQPDSWIFKVVFDLSVLKTPLMFLGWQETKGKLQRVAYNNSLDEAVLAKNEAGEVIQTDIPKRLRFVKFIKIDTGITYNLCSENVAEMANLLTSNVAEQDTYWSDVTREHLNFCADLGKATLPFPVTLADLHLLTSDTAYLNIQLERLSELIEQGTKEVTEEVVLRYKDLHAYFSTFFNALEVKTKACITTGITNLLGSFHSDAKLNEVFCTSSTVKLDEIIQEGKIVSVVTPGGIQAGKLAGKIVKAELQKLLVNRVVVESANKTRRVLIAYEEAQNYITPGILSPAEDTYCMSLARQSSVTNLVAAQSMASVNSVLKPNDVAVYFQMFNTFVFYTNLDVATQEECDKLLVRIEGAEKIDLSQLNVHEAVIVERNKSVTKVQLKPDSYGYPDNRAKALRVSTRYFNALIENRLNSEGMSGLLEG